MKVWNEEFSNLLHVWHLCFSLQPGHYSSLTAPNLQHTASQERNDQCGNQHYSREVLLMGIVVFFFFLSVLHYNSQCRVLAFRTSSFHLPLSWTTVFQFGTFNLCISFLTSSSHRIFGLPIGLFEMGFQACIALTILVSCILSIWPYHPSLCALAKFNNVLIFY